MKENTASSTAYTVLQGLLYVARHTPHADLVDGETRKLGEAVLSHSEEGRKRLAQLDKSFFVRMAKLREFIFLPGITLHYALRKRCIESQAREMIAGGVTQVVVLGAGFDSLALRLAREFKHVTFIETDHPDTQREKARALEAQAEGDNLHFLDIDFTHQNLEGRLAPFAPFDAGRPTLFICEGVTMYLTEADVIHMFSAIRDMTGPGTKLLFTAVEPEGSPRTNVRKLLFVYLRLIGEPIKWSLDSTALPQFLESRQCRLLTFAGTDEFKAQFMQTDDGTTLHRGEYVALAEFT